MPRPLKHSIKDNTLTLELTIKEILRDYFKVDKDVVDLAADAEIHLNINIDTELLDRAKKAKASKEDAKNKHDKGEKHEPN